MKVDELGVWEQLQKKITWEQLGKFSGKRILEFGCSNGMMGAHYAKENTVARAKDLHINDEGEAI